MRLLIFDIDGVLTDGTVQVDGHGQEYKRFLLNDIDALNQFVRENMDIAAITGEDTALADYFSKKVPWKYFEKGCKQKLEVFQRILQLEACSPEEVAYVGDGLYDVPILEYLPKSICPANAIPKAKSAAKIHLKSSGGNGCVVELYEMIKTGQI